MSTTEPCPYRTPDAPSESSPPSFWIRARTWLATRWRARFGPRIHWNENGVGIYTVSPKFSALVYVRDSAIDPFTNELEIVLGSEKSLETLHRANYRAYKRWMRVSAARADARTFLRNWLRERYVSGHGRLVA